MDWLHLLLNGVAPAHADLFDGLVVKKSARQPGTLLVYRCPLGRRSRLFYAGQYLFEAIEEEMLRSRSIADADTLHEPIRKILIFSDDGKTLIVALSRVEPRLWRQRQMERFERIYHDNLSSLIQIARTLEDSELRELINCSQVPAVLTDMKTGRRYVVADSYIKWIGHRNKAAFMAESGATNAGRWGDGELERFQRLIEREPDQILVNHQYNAARWDQKGQPSLWTGSFGAIVYQGRSCRLGFFTHWEQGNLVAV